MTLVRLLLTFGLPVFLSLTVLLLFVLMMQARSREWDRWEAEYAALQEQRVHDAEAVGTALADGQKAVREYIERQMVIVNERLDSNEADVQGIVDPGGEDLAQQLQDVQDAVRDWPQNVVAAICEADYGVVVAVNAIAGLTEYLEGRDDARSILDYGVLIDDGYAHFSGVCQVDAYGSWQLLSQHPQVDPRRRE